MRRWGLVLVLLLAPATLEAAQNTLTWQDNADNETSQHIERTIAPDVPACQMAGDWVQIVVTFANVTSFVDQAVNEGTTYCYRLRASNPGGFSPYSNVAGRSVPFVPPLAQSNLQAGP